MGKVRTLCCALSLAVAGCQGANLALAPSAVPASHAPHPIAPGTSQALIYISDVYVYAYTFSGKQVTELTGFASPAGLCADNKGDVYITDAGSDLIYEYARGGSLPINVLDDRGQTPNSCAVDPTTGNLAVANLGPPPSRDKGGNVLIYPPGSGQYGVPYSTPKISRYEYCVYDSSGNLYVDGGLGYESLRLAELPSGATKFTDIALTGLAKGHHNPGGVQWDGHDLAVADGIPNLIYRIAVTGSSGKVVGNIHLADWRLHFAPQFALNGKRLLFPFANKGELAFFPYPRGGHPTGGFFGNVGDAITISR